VYFLVINKNVIHPKGISNQTTSGDREEAGGQAGPMTRPVYLVGKCARPRLARAPHLAERELLRMGFYYDNYDVIMTSYSHT
jgi:hypothetical protein